MSTVIQLFLRVCEIPLLVPRGVQRTTLHAHLHPYICVLRGHFLLSLSIGAFRCASIAKYKVKWRKKAVSPSQAFQLHKNIYVHASDIKFTISVCRIYAAYQAYWDNADETICYHAFYIILLCCDVASVDLTSRAKKRRTN